MLVPAPDSSASPSEPVESPESAYPNYEPADVARLFSPVHTLALGQASRAQRFLEGYVETGFAYAATLAQYPAVRAEPLDFHYICLQSLGALDVLLIEDLTKHHGWRGIVWAAWLSMLAPHSDYLPHLEDAIARAPYNAWLLEIAIQLVQDQYSRTAPEFGTAILALRNQLQPLPRPNVRLARVPSREVIEAHRAQMAAAYRALNRVR